jgi:hypothetical protein
MEPLQASLTDVYTDLGIAAPSELFVRLSQDYSNDKDVISLLQRVCYELSPETERQLIVSLEDAVLFAHDLGYNNIIDVNKSSVAVAELMYFLAIELQSRRLALQSDPLVAQLSHVWAQRKNYNKIHWRPDNVLRTRNF